MAQHEINQMEIGTPVVQWEVDEYPHHKRSQYWYVLGAIVAVGLIMYSIATANFLFAVIILMIGVITLLSTFLPPDRIPVILTNTGIVVGDMYYDYESLQDFSIAYDPPDVKYLYFEFHSPWQPLLSIPLEDNDPNEIREVLMTYCYENMDRTEENLTDLMRRLYKL